MPGQTADQNFDSFFDASFPTDMSGTMADLRRNLIEPGLRIASQHDVFVTITQKDWLSWVVQGLTNARTAQGRIRLLILTPSDTSKKSIENTIWTIRSGLQRLVDQNLDSNAEQVQDLQSLGKLAQLRSIECKLAHASQVPDFGHYFGIMHDREGEMLTYETRGVINLNETHVDIRTSCQDWDSCKRVESRFRELWNGSNSGILTTDVSKRFNDMAQAIAGPVSSLYESEDDQTFERSKLWPHQQVAFDRFLESKRGVLEMATGTGKTRTALAICKSIAKRGEVNHFIISTEGNDILEQWYQECLHCFRAVNGKRWSVIQHYGKKKNADHAKEFSVLVCRRGVLASALRRAKKKNLDVALVHDEVHGLGSAKNIEDLADIGKWPKYRLGLSATPERIYDETGTIFIQETVGPIVYKYELKDAIKDKILCPLDYLCLEYAPSDVDKNNIVKVFKRKAARSQSGQVMSDAELHTALALVHKTSEVKLDLFSELLKKRSEILQRCLIFVATKEYGEKVMKIVHRYSADFHTYFDGDNTETLQRFIQGEIQSLVTCHRLSEGIDIPEIKNIVLFSSDRSQLETIQRIGRALRRTTAGDKKKATIVDFARVSETGENLNSDQVRKNWLEELAEYSESIEQC